MLLYNIYCYQDGQLVPGGWHGSKPIGMALARLELEFNCLSSLGSISNLKLRWETSSLTFIQNGSQWEYRVEASRREYCVGWDAPIMCMWSFDA